MASQYPLLSFLIWLPIIVGGLLYFIEGRTAWTHSAKWLAVCTAGICFACSIKLYLLFDPKLWTMQCVEQYQWLPNLGIAYSLGIDGFSLPLIILTCFITLLVIFSGLDSVTHKPVSYFANFLVMQGLMIGVFAALDAILFYIFFEAMLVPMFLIIGTWGGANRIYATLKFFLYTFFGSIFLLIALIYLHTVAERVGLSGTDTFSIMQFQQLTLSLTEQKWLFWAFLIAFAVKIPMWPVHTWLPDAHVEAPTEGSMILAAITLKMGGYGLLRFLLPMLPMACQYFAPVIIILSLIAIVYIGLIAIVQQDMKKLIAYSSVSHMGFVTLGLFLVFDVMNHSQNMNDAAMGITGAMAQMISHGFISAALFFCIGILYRQVKSKKISDYGGVVNVMPVFASFFLLFCMANSGLPGTSGFVGEFLVILTAFKAKFLYAFFAALTLILGAAYTLWMYKRVINGPVASNTIAGLRDIQMVERGILLVLAALVLGIGVWPLPVLDMVHASATHLITQVFQARVMGL